MSSKAKFLPVIVCVVAAVSPVFGAPIITDFSPTAGGPGDKVQLTGSGFLSGNLNVGFGNPPGVVQASIVFINSDTIMTVSVPNGVTTGPISIQQSGQSPFFTARNFLAVGTGPYISAVLPPYGAVNDTVVLTGVHLGSPTSVQFSGVSANEFVANAAGTQITTRVPSGATNGLITVTTILGTTNSPGPFTVVGPGPFITGFSPSSGDAGTMVEIDGLHFTGVTNVTFNGQPGVNLVANSDILIRVQAPPGVTSGPLAVHSPNFTATTISNFLAKPSIAKFSPASGRSGTNVLVVGTNFLDATAVLFNGVLATFSVVNNSNLNAVVPAGATTGPIRVLVGGASAFSATNFIVGPTISGFSPAFGPAGSSITITGANLNGGTPIVRFNGVSAAAPTGVTFSQMVATVPVGATTGPISITTTDGSYTNANLFFLPGTITSFTPTNSAPGSRVTITGQNLTGASAVRFNGTPATAFTVTNNATIGATVPSNVITGPITVTTPAGVIQSAGSFYGAPVITNFAPTHGLPGTNVTIKGVNFLLGKVQFSGLNAAIVSLNNTQIVATVPSGAQTGPLTVSGSAGTNTTAENFVLDYQSDLSVTITNSSNPVTIGSNLVFTVSIANNGPVSAPNATLTNILPATATLRSATIDGPWSLLTNGTSLTGGAANLAAGSLTKLVITVTPQVAGTITNTISVTSGNPDPVPGNNTVSIATIVEPLALLSIKSTGDLVRVSWPVLLTNYVLQAQNALAANSQWLNVTTPSTISGTLKLVMETNNGSARFYRLQK